MEFKIENIYILKAQLLLDVKLKEVYIYLLLFIFDFFPTKYFYMLQNQKSTKK